MSIALRGIAPPSPTKLRGLSPFAVGTSRSLPQQWLAGEAAGLAINFRGLTPELLIKDPSNPSNRYDGDPAGKITTTRTNPAWYFDSTGTLKQAAANTARYTYDPVTLTSLGLLIEPPRTNSVAWCRDLTNAVWTKSNVTAAKNQVGIDGVANAASSITATANLGTVLQAIALASAAAFQSAFVRRLVGTGTLEMTMDGGTTWTLITPSGSGWLRLSIPSQTLANPSVGFRIGTSGDSFAIDAVQNEGGNYITTPILTTTSAFTRGIESHAIVLSALPFTNSVGTVYAMGVSNAPNNVQRSLYQFDDGTSNNRVIGDFSSLGGGQMAVYSGGGAVANILPGTVATGKSSRMTGTWQANDARAALDGTFGTPNTTMTVPVGMTTLRIGTAVSASFPLGGTIAEFVWVPRSATNTELQNSSLFGWGVPVPIIDIAPNNPSIEDSDYAATLTKTATSVSGVRPITFLGYENANPAWRRRFKTSSGTSTVIFHLQNLNLVPGSYNGRGVIYVDGVLTQYWTSAQAAGVFYARLDFATPGVHDVELVMPYSASIAFFGMTTFGNPVSAPTVSRTGLPRAVWLGDSRAQGFQASGVDTHGFEILCRAKGWQNINLGYGSARVTAAWGTTAAQVNPDILFITFDYNNRTDQTPLATFYATYQSLIANFRALKPTTPIYVVSSNWISAANDSLTLKIADYRTQEANLVTALNIAGDVNIFYVNGLPLTTNSLTSVPDGIHPNDTGWSEWATNIAPILQAENLVLLGDSRLTAALGPATNIAALFPSRVTSVQALSGQRSDEITGRFVGGASVTVSGNSIPTSGSVSITSSAPDLFHHQSVPCAIHGTVGSVAGTLSFDGTSSTTFTRDASGSAVAVPNPVQFIPDSGTAFNSISAAGQYPLVFLYQDLAIVGFGYNDIYTATIQGGYTYSQAATMANVATCIAALQNAKKQYLVLGVFFGEQLLVNGAGGIGSGQSTVGTSPSQATSQTAINQIVALNSALSSTYSANYVDLQAAYVTAGYGEAATVNGSPYTLINNTLLPDGVHASTSTGKTLTASIIQNAMISLGYA